MLSPSSAVFVRALLSDRYKSRFFAIRKRHFMFKMVQYSAPQQNK